MWSFTRKKTEPPIKIAIIEAHPILREGIAEYLVGYKFSVTMKCGNGMEFMSQVDAENLPDILLMDVRETKASDLHHPVKSMYPSIKIVVMAIEREQLQGVEEDETIQAYISKAVDPSVFKVAIKAVMKGKRFYEFDDYLVR